MQSLTKSVAQGKMSTRLLQDRSLRSEHNCSSGAYRCVANAAGTDPGGHRRNGRGGSPMMVACALMAGLGLAGRRPEHQIACIAETVNGGLQKTLTTSTRCAGCRRVPLFPADGTAWNGGPARVRPSASRTGVQESAGVNAAEHTRSVYACRYVSIPPFVQFMLRGNTDAISESQAR